MNRWVRAAAGIWMAAMLAYTSAHAECGDSQVLRLYEKHISVSKIADRCEMNVDDVADIVANRHIEKDDPERDPEPARNPGDPAPRQAYCCDTYGNSRCPIAYGDTTIGSSCFCPGQGYGVICR